MKLIDRHTNLVVALAAVLTYTFILSEVWMFTAPTLAAVIAILAAVLVVSGGLVHWMEGVLHDDDDVVVALEQAAAPAAAAAPAPRRARRAPRLAAAAH